MCEECYNDAGRPAIINEKTLKCADLIREVYADGGVGGYAHIVLDDYNTETENVKYCLKKAIEGGFDWIGEEERQACIECMRFMLDMTEPERYAALAIVDGYLKVTDHDE